MGADRPSSLSASAIVEAHERIARYIVRTPLIRAHEIERRYGSNVPVYFKCEQFQRTRSFKERGAYNALLRLPDAIKERGVVTRSSGNFAQALACAAHRLGIVAHIVMPTSAPAVKIENTRRWGPTVILHGTTHVQGMAKVNELVAAHGFHYISPFDDDAIIAGQGTAAREITEALEEPLSHFYCPVGGGGLMAGCALWLRYATPAQIVAVEPDSVNDFALSFARRERVTIEAPKSIADGLLTPSVGETNWPILRDCVDVVETVSEQAIREAVFILGRDQNMIVEPSGATAFAALLQHLRSGASLTGATVCMVSGGNVDPSFFADVWQHFQGP